MQKLTLKINRYRQGRTLNYYKITQVSPAYKQVWAIRYRQGKKASEPYLIAPPSMVIKDPSLTHADPISGRKTAFKSWGIYHHPCKIQNIKNLLKINK